jgi:hypothetical protein
MERVILLLCLLSSSAPAQPDEGKKASPGAMDEAQRHFRRGKELYEDNDYQGALVEFRRAYDLAPSFRLLYNIAEMHYQLQDYPAALRYFARYLQDGGADVPSDRREEVQKEIERLRARVASVFIETNRIQAEISVDDVPVGKSPLPDKVLVSAGRRKITATIPGRLPVSKVIEVAGQESVRVALEFAPDPVASTDLTAAVPAESRPTVDVSAAPHKSRNAWLPWTITGALGVGALTTGLLAIKASNDMQSQRATYGATRGQLDAAVLNEKRLGWVSDSLSGATLVAAGISLYLMLSADPEEHHASLAVGVGPGTVALTGEF